MEWNVYYFDINSRRMKIYNVLKHREDAVRKLRRKAKTIEEFAESLRSEMMYYYWSKYEWEMVIASYGGTTDGSEAIKIDVWDQISLNFDKFVEYCWNYMEKPGRKKKDGSGI